MRKAVSYLGSPGNPEGRETGRGKGSCGGKSLISAAAICSGLSSVGSPVCVRMCCWRTRALAYFLWQTGHWWNIRIGGFDLDGRRE